MPAQRGIDLGSPDFAPVEAQDDGARIKAPEGKFEPEWASGGRCELKVERAFFLSPEPRVPAVVFPAEPVGSDPDDCGSIMACTYRWSGGSRSPPRISAKPFEVSTRRSRALLERCAADNRRHPACWPPVSSWPFRRWC